MSVHSVSPLPTIIPFFIPFLKLFFFCLSYSVSRFILGNPEISFRYFVDGKKYFETDTFAHEQALLVTEEGKSVLFVGAAHAGLKQMMERAEKTYQRPVSAVVGALALTDKKGKPIFGEEWVRFRAGKIHLRGILFCVGRGGRRVQRFAGRTRRAHSPPFRRRNERTLKL